MNTIVVLNRKRGNLKGQITRMVTFLTEEIETSDITELNLKVESVKKIQEKHEELKLDYYKLLKDEELDEHEQVFEEMDQDIEKIEVGLKRQLSKLKIESNVINEQPTQTCKHKSIRLPEICLPKFSGLCTDWYLFKSQFKSIIEENDQLTESQKLFYLQSSLSGRAKEVQTTDDTYSSLWETLTTRFENKRLIVDSHINELLGLEKMTHESPKELRNLIDKIHKHLRALKLMELEPNKLTQMILTNLILNRLDKTSRQQFEMTIRSNDLLDWDDFMDFLQKRYLALENIHGNSSMHGKPKFVPNTRSKSFVSKTIATENNNCKLCKLSSHKLYNCREFLNMSVKQRYDTVKKLNLCLNCISSSAHRVLQCPSSISCFCGRKHNRLLHINKPDTTIDSSNGDGNLLPPLSEEKKNGSPNSSLENSVSHAPSVNLLASCAIEQEIKNEQTGINRQEVSNCLLSSKNKTVFLLTANIFVPNSEGSLIKGRSIIDPGSQLNYMSASFADRINLPRRKANITVSGLNCMEIKIKSKIYVTISNQTGSFERTLECFIVKRITNETPSRFLDVSGIKWPQGITLADNNFNIPSQIDLLLGGEVFFDIIKPHRVVVENTNLKLQQSVFGYLVTGAMENTASENKGYCGLGREIENINDTLQKFWNIERVEEDIPIKGKEEIYCEEHFRTTHSRDSSGRYVVKMPMKEDICSALGESREMALRRLNSLWRRLKTDPNMELMYKNFIHEYKSLGHMEPVIEEREPESCYYLCHHGIYNANKPTTKLRVVFDGSAATTSGNSLNSQLLNGGLIQEDLFDILIRFRKHRYAFVADVRQMYRQIVIHPDQRKFQRILWKDGPDLPVEVFQLTTVTYGLLSSSFLATRTLKQLVYDEGKNFPLASTVALQDFFMDDVLTGAETLDSAKELQLQLINLLERGVCASTNGMPTILNFCQMSLQIMRTIHFKTLMK